MILMQVSLLVLAALLAYVVLTPRITLPLLAEIGLGVASICAVIIALGSIERSLGHAPPNSSLGGAFVLLVVSATVAILSLVAQRPKADEEG